MRNIAKREWQVVFLEKRIMKRTLLYLKATSRVQSTLLRKISFLLAVSRTRSRP